MDEDAEGAHQLSLSERADSMDDTSHLMQRKYFQKDLSTFPLHRAAMNRSVASMKALLSMGSDPEKWDKLGRTSLHLVIMSWPTLLTSNTDLPNASPFLNLLVRVRNKVEACLQLLCEHGVDINAQVAGACRETALHIAVSFSALTAIQILTRFGAEVNVMDGIGMNPLHRAAGTLNKDIILHLIKQGADVNMGVVDSGSTPLHIAVGVFATLRATPKHEDLQCVTELLKHGGDPNTCNNQCMTPLHEACQMGCTAMVDLLLDYGGNPNKVNKAGHNCLFIFLNKGVELTNNKLFSKLIGLTSPLILHNKSDHLPSSLNLPCNSEFKQLLLRLAQEPRSLKSICKAVIFLQQAQNKEDYRQMLPPVLYKFVFKEWDILGKSFIQDSIIP